MILASFFVVVAVLGLAGLLLHLQVPQGSGRQHRQPRELFLLRKAPACLLPDFGAIYAIRDLSRGI